MSKRDQSNVDPSSIRRSPGISYQKLLDQDSRPVPDYLRIDARPVFKLEPGHVELVYEIDEGKPFRIGQILPAETRERRTR